MPHNLTVARQLVHFPGLMGRERSFHEQRKVNLMAKKRTSQTKTKAENSDRQPKPMPMPEAPGDRAPSANPMMPLATPMPGPEASSVANPSSPTGEAPRVLSLDDYPSGRGGMRMVPMGTGEAPNQSPDRFAPEVQGRPPATKMPSA